MPRHLLYVLMIACVLSLAGASVAPAAEQPRRRGSFSWFVYADPARLDIHTESPLSVQQAVAGIYSGLLQYDPMIRRKSSPT